MKDITGNNCPSWKLWVLLQLRAFSIATSSLFVHCPRLIRDLQWYARSILSNSGWCEVLSIAVSFSDNHQMW
jgi:hypothetical protein